MNKMKSILNINMLEKDGKRIQDMGGSVLIVVACCVPKHAKTLKNYFEKGDLFDKRYRITKCISRSDLLAIPLKISNASIDSVENIIPEEFRNLIVCFESQICPLSSSGVAKKINFDTNVKRAVACALVHAAKKLRKQPENFVTESLERFNFPKRLELIGDPPHFAILLIPVDKVDFFQENILRSFVENIIGFLGQDDWDRYQTIFYEYLAGLHRVKRVISKAVVDADSKIRESRSKLLFLEKGFQEWLIKSLKPSIPSQYLLGWTTITEHNLSMSLDLTKVMYSRGNVTEKHRFGSLVREGEVVLDMYAGIGYYTLPALIFGHAKFVYACEWNAHAVFALKYNLLCNNVQDRAKVFEGDSRINARSLEGRIDRISLGLLPSSEGGWPTAVRALNKSKGGWLHIHANVPVLECDCWALWCLDRLVRFADDCGREWVALCVNIQTVKSFAPKVDHIVADIYLGPRDVVGMMTKVDVSSWKQVTRFGHLSKDNLMVQGDFEKVTQPSCALRDDGPINQQWMR